MQTPPENQTLYPPVRPEYRTNREERRQKACALRTFKGAKNLSLGVCGAAGTEKAAGRGCLSIQIDTLPAMPVTARSTTKTEFTCETPSPDIRDAAGNRIMSGQYRRNKRDDRSDRHGDRNRRAYDSSRVREEQNA